MVALRSQGNWRWEGPLGTPLGLVHWKRWVSSYIFWLYHHTWTQPWLSALANSSLCNSLLFPQSFTSTSSLQLLIIHYCPMLSAHYCLMLSGFPCASAGEESTCNVGDLGSIPGLGRSPGEGIGLPTPVFWPGEFHGL